MSGSDPAAGDDRTFRVNFSGEGATRLRETVKEKLKEFMGDYTDDTLAEYVVVLLRNGRRKDEARKELNVFLGDDSVSFVSWLWDHLSSNLHLYVQLRESFQPEGHRTRPTIHSQSEHASDNVQPDSESEREKPEKISRSRRKREWKGLVQGFIEPPLLRSSLIENSQPEKKTLHKRSPIRQSHSPRPRINKKRSRLDEPLPAKREVASHSMLDAPRRLLQFAVRDAVRTVQQSTLRSEPTLKRLRSVVSTSTVDSALDGLPLKPKSVARVPGAVATAIKAAAEAAEDVVKVKSSANVFDRLGNGMDGAKISTQSLDYRAPMLEDGEYDFDQIQGLKGADYYQRSDHDREFAGDMTMLDGDTGMASDFVSDNEGYDSVGIPRHRIIDAPQHASSAVKDKESLMVQYNVDQNADDASRNTRTKDQDPRITTAANTSGKILNISVNVNTWKPHHYQSSREVMEVENQLAVEKNEPSAGKPSIRFPKEKSSSLAENQNEAIGPVAQKDSQKTVATPGSYSTGRPSEDADSRTVFVNNVHYAATKDTLSRHFNKFGEVLKVIIVTDAATGQPKGSAYVEFLRKESAELALSLNGTSFMSRILKVVRRSSAHFEAAPVMSWPRRASPFASRLARVPYSRAMMPSAFRARLPIKVGARSLQWKRDTPGTPTAEGTKSLQSPSVSGGQRHLTYIRTGPKPDANSDPV